jgi:predicted outer membrane repeat protein
MFNGNGSNALVTNCTFDGNVADPANGGGGGIYNFQSSPWFVGCTFQANSGLSGGGMRNFDNSSPTIVDCVFTDNSATGASGGGVANEQGSSPLFVNCWFLRNDAAGNGGAIMNYNSSHTMAMNCTFWDNLAVSWSGGLRDGYNCSSTLTNCTFNANSAGDAGGAISAGSDTSGSTGHTVLNNCILWANSAGLGPEIALIGTFPAMMTLAYSDVEGGQPSVFVQVDSTMIWGAGNIDLDPMFVDAPTGNYRLSAGSPCIDAADNTAVPPDTTDLDDDGNVIERTPLDLDGNPRFRDDPDTPDTGFGLVPPIVDIGAYEFAPLCPQDVNGDGAVNVLDLIEVLLCFGQPANPPCDSADLNGDGTANVLDLIELLLAFGQTCS